MGFFCHLLLLSFYHLSNQNPLNPTTAERFRIGMVEKFQKGSYSNESVTRRIIKVDGESRSVYLHSDMIMSKALMRNLQLLSSPLRTKRWAYRDSYYPNTIWQDGVPYEMDSSLPEYSKKSLMRAMKIWQDNTCVTFRQRANETQYILYTAENDGCFSTVGKDDDQEGQPVNIGKGCDYIGVTTHEIGHALGLFHHHQRYDRDDYVIFDSNAVDEFYYDNFLKIPEQYLDTYGLPYDTGSVMHYTPTEFGRDMYVPVLLAKDQNFQGTLGNLQGPSFLDMQIINEHYQCYDACNNTMNNPQCLNGGYVNPLNCSECKCPPGFGGYVCQLIESSAPINCGGLIPTSSKLTRMRVRLFSEGNQRRKCVYHIRAPPNRRVMIGLETVEAVCEEGCFISAVEMKMSGDFRKTGYRFCCKSHQFRRIISRGRNVPIIFFAQNSAVDVVLHFRWVARTPDAEDARYLNATELSEVYTQSDNDNGLDMEILQGPDYEPITTTAPITTTGTSANRKRLRREEASDDSDYVGEYGSDGESYEDFSVY